MIKLHQLKLILGNLQELNVLNTNLVGRFQPNKSISLTSNLAGTPPDKNQSESVISKKHQLEVECVKRGEIVSFLNSMRLDHINTHTCITTSCLKHSRSKLKLHMLHKVHINSTTGHFVCSNCQHSGSWQQFVHSCLHLDHLLNNKKRLSSSCFNNESCVEDNVNNPLSSHARKLYQDGLPLDQSQPHKLQQILTDLKLHHLSITTLSTYHIRVSCDYLNLIFPFYSFNHNIVAVKIFSVDREEVSEDDSRVEDSSNDGSTIESSSSKNNDGSSGSSSGSGGKISSSGSSTSISRSIGDSSNRAGISSMNGVVDNTGVNLDKEDKGETIIRRDKGSDEGIDVDTQGTIKTKEYHQQQNNNDDDDGVSESQVNNNKLNNNNNHQHQLNTTTNNNNNNVSKNVTITTKTFPSSDVCGLFGYHLLLNNTKNNNAKKSKITNANNNANNKHNFNTTTNYTSHHNNTGSIKGGVVLTGSEVDAMAVWQETGKVAVALSQQDLVLSQKILPLLESQDKLMLWLGGEGGGRWQKGQVWARKLNIQRCHLVRPDQETPTEAIQNGLDLHKILASSRSISHQSITTFHHLREDVFATLSDATTMAGVQWRKYPHLNKLLKGHRRGELTVLTGPTGSGKTTFISDYSLDLSMQGVNTLWGSFEINNIKLLKTMLSQFSQLDLSKNLDCFGEYADQFERLPIYFMTFHGQENIRKVIETMSHAAYVYDIAHVIVDNLQFMIGLEDGHDRFLKQDLVVSAFRKFATHTNCHVTLVIHPRKEKEKDNLSISSIFGGAKATQEADNVLILQDNRLLNNNKKFIQVAKNRYDGDLGMMRLKFDKSCLSFHCPDHPPPPPTTPTLSQTSSSSSSSSSSSTPSSSSPPTSGLTSSPKSIVNYITTHSSAPPSLSSTIPSTTATTTLSTTIIKTSTPTTLQTSKSKKALKRVSSKNASSSPPPSSSSSHLPPLLPPSLKKS